MCDWHIVRLICNIDRIRLEISFRGHKGYRETSRRLAEFYYSRLLDKQHDAINIVKYVKYCYCFRLTRKISRSLKHARSLRRSFYNGRGGITTSNKNLRMENVKIWLKQRNQHYHKHLNNLHKRVIYGHWWTVLVNLLIWSEQCFKRSV